MKKGFAGLAALLFYISLLLLPGNMGNSQSIQRKKDKERVLKQLDYDRVFYFQENKKYMIKEDNIKEEHREFMRELDNQNKYDELKTFHVSYDLDGNGIVDLMAEFEIEGINFNNINEIDKVYMDYAAKKVWVDKEEDAHFETRYSNEDNDVYLDTKLPSKGEKCREDAIKKIDDERIFRYSENIDYLIKKNRIQEDSCEGRGFICAEYDFNGDGIPEITAKFRLSDLEVKKNQSTYCFFENKATEVKIDKDYDGIPEAIYMDVYPDCNEKRNLESKISR